MKFPVLLLLSLHSWTACGGVISFEQPGLPQTITALGQYIVDEGASSAFESIRESFEAGAGQEIVEKELYLGSMQGAVWIRFSLSNPTNARHLVLEVENPRLLEVDLYDRNGISVVVKRSGASRPFYEREILFPSPAFMIAVPPESNREYFLRVANTGDMRVSARLWTHEDFDRYSVRATMPSLVFAGVLLAFALYHVCIWIALRRLIYLLIAILVVSIGLLFLAMNGTGSMLLWYDWPWYAERAVSVPTFLCSGFGILFIGLYLEIWRYHRRGWYGVLAVAGFCFAGLVVAVTTDHLVRMQLMRLAGFLGPMAGLYLVGSAIYHRQRAGWYLLLTWGFTMMMGVVMVLAGMGLVSTTLLDGRLLAAVFLAAILFWSFEMTGRIRKREQAKRGQLESQVEVATSELKTALQEVQALSGLLPICGHCKKIRDDRGYWNSVESYLRRHTEADFTHGICPDCMKEHFPDYSK